VQREEGECLFNHLPTGGKYYTNSRNSEGGGVTLLIRPHGGGTSLGGLQLSEGRAAIFTLRREIPSFRFSRERMSSVSEEGVIIIGRGVMASYMGRGEKGGGKVVNCQSHEGGKREDCFHRPIEEKAHLW